VLFFRPSYSGPFGKIFLKKYYQETFSVRVLWIFGQAWKAILVNMNLKTDRSVRLKRLE